MTRTLLFDLDNTLLLNSMESFLPAYLQALSVELAGFGPPAELIDTLLAATRQMVRNRRPDCTLRDVFEYHFYPALGVTVEEVQPYLDHFYSEVFPSLRKQAQPRPEAVELVSRAFERGDRVVIATNPLFPRTAILQRLEWAGLSVEKFPYDLVTSCEDFHFSKPHPEFYAEILSRLGWPEGPVVMVGDDPENDINPARKLGLPAFWVPLGQSPALAGLEPPTRAGALSELLPWLDETAPETLAPDYASPRSMLATLLATPAALHTICSGLTERAWQQAPAPGQWCPTEIICHLRDVDLEVNFSRLQKLVEEENPFIPGKDTDPWAEERDYKNQDGPRALQSFIIARLRILDLLEALPSEGWQRPARHAIIGPTTLQELVGIIAAHDRLHVRQILNV